MTERLAWSVCLCAAVLLAPAAQAQTAGARERVAPEGPYRSQVRILDDPGAVAAPTDLDAADDYGKALILRQLAFASIARGDRAAAIADLERALALETLAPLATAQMRANLGQLYLAANEPARAAELLAAARAAGIGDATLAIAHASAELDNGRYAEAAAAAREALAARDDAPDSWLQLLVHALARAGRPGAAVGWQRQLLARAPGEAQRWLTLAGLYARDGNPAHAAATLSAAAASGVALDSEQRRQLVALLAEAGLPDLAAEELEALISDRTEQPLLAWLAQLRLEAHDEPGALAALERLATLSGSATDWVRAGEYALATGLAERAIASLRRAQSAGDDGAASARALLLLGQTHLARGEIREARRALEQASAYGGSAYRTAARWLEELPRENGAETPPATPAATPTATVVARSEGASATVSLKSVPSLRVYAASRFSTAAELTEDAAALVSELLRATRRDRIEWTGPLQIVVEGDIGTPEAQLELSVAAPIRRVTPSRGQFGARELDAFRCAWVRYEGPWSGLAQAWRELYADVVAAGHAPSAEARQVVLHRARAGGTSIVELQIGIL